MTVQDEMQRTFGEVDVDGSLTAIDLTTGHRVETSGQTAYALASVAKLPLTWALMTLHERGDLDAAEPLALRPAERTRGPVGTGRLHDAITMSARDACYYAMSLSDNGAADAVWDLVGRDRLTATLAALDLPDLQLRAPMREYFRLLDRQVARSGLDEDALLDVDPADLDAIDPARVSSATTNALAAFLAQVHRAAGSGSPADRQVLELLGHQLVRNRLASGFPATDVDVRGKTGTMLALRHEAGIVTYPDGRAYAVAVLTRSRTLDIHYRVDHAIGEAARLAVQHLRRT